MSSLAIVLASALLLACKSNTVTDESTSVADAPRAPAPADTALLDTNLCERLEALSKTAKPKLFAEIGAPDSDAKPEWREFETNEAMSELEHYTDASVWSSKEGWFVAVSLTSPSDDWVHDVEYCFRPDGSIVHAASELRTMYADPNPVERSRRTVFAADGRQISREVKVVDRETKRVLEDPSFQDQDETLYKSVRDVPFARFLSLPKIP